MRKLASTIAAVMFISAVMLGFSARDAQSIPAFARKYQTSCHTCHVSFPKLNPFGKAFRLRGYRMPGETEDMVKEEPMVMEQEAYRRLWPNALWPSDIPGTVPLSVDLQLASLTAHDEAEATTIKNDFRFPESLGLLAGGTLGETLSFLAELEFERENEHGESGVAVEIGHAEFHFNGPFDTGTAFNVKLGRFTPEVAQTFSHGYLQTDAIPNVIFGFNPIGFHGSREISLGHVGHGGGGGGISFPGAVDGIETYGVVNHRFLYSAGISNGIGPGDVSFDGNNAKDVFGGVAYKIGGMALDGEDYEPSEENWSETSLQVGAFAYRGDGEGIFFEGTGHHGVQFAEDREFTRYGFDVNAYIGDLNVIGGFIAGDDTNAVYEPVEDEHGGDDEHAEEEDDHGIGEIELVRTNDDDYKSAFVEADYVVYPWLQAALRYEWLRPSSTSEGNFKLVTANLTALIRANVKALFEFARVVGGPGEKDYRANAGLRFAF